jgi:GNAT superfamily N-acetyltransferase
MYEIRDAGPATLADFQHFFEHVGFADNPRWASCWCHFPHADHARIEWQARGAAENRAASCERLCDGRMRGLLAYAPDAAGRPAPIGWCNAGPRPLVDGLFDEPEPERTRIGSIVCFVIAPAWRRRGVAAALLDAACARFAAQGLAVAEAYPLKDATSAAAMHFGPAAMFRAAGFEIHREDDDRWWMRRALT